jgi:hypothetical protein
VVRVAGNPPYGLRSCLADADYVCQQSPMITPLDATTRGSAEHSSPGLSCNLPAHRSSRTPKHNIALLLNGKAARRLKRLLPRLLDLFRRGRFIRRSRSKRRGADRQPDQPHLAGASTIVDEAFSAIPRVSRGPTQDCSRVWIIPVLHCDGNDL